MGFFEFASDNQFFVLVCLTIICITACIASNNMGRK